MGLILWDLFKHVCRWLVNLRRAGDARQRASIDAARATVGAARETAVYLRQMHDTGQRNHATERQLTRQWTELGFQLEDLGLSKLAKRCQITAKHWSNPQHYDEDFLDKADVSVDRMERLALEILKRMEC